jgi:hypothetical protein
VYFIVKGKEEQKNVSRTYSDSNPRFRKAYHETMEKVAHSDPKELAPQRRWNIKAMRFQGKTPELVAKARAIYDAMSKEING